MDTRFGSAFRLKAEAQNLIYRESDVPKPGSRYHSFWLNSMGDIKVFDDTISLAKLVILASEDKEAVKGSVAKVLLLSSARVSDFSSKSSGSKDADQVRWDTDLHALAGTVDFKAWLLKALLDIDNAEAMELRVKILQL